MKNVFFGVLSAVFFAVNVQAGDCCKEEKVCCDVTCCRPTLAERVAERRAERACERAERVACRVERRAARNCCKPVCCDPCCVVAVSQPVAKKPLTEGTKAVAGDSFAEAVANSTPCCGN